MNYSSGLQFRRILLPMILWISSAHASAMEKSVSHSTGMLPDAYLGTWQQRKYWSKGKNSGPYHWVGLKITEDSHLTVSSGEQSKDSGSRSATGEYVLRSGKGSPQTPFVIDFHISALNNSGTQGYSNNFPIGKDSTEAWLYLQDGLLHIGIDRIGSFVLKRITPGSE